MILRFLKKILQNQLFKVASLSSFSILIRLITGFVSSKSIAHFIGPAGMGLTGNLRNFGSLLESIGTLGLQNGVVQFVAKNHQKKEKLATFVYFIFWILLASSLLISLVLIFGNSFFGKILFNSYSEYNTVLYFVAAILPFQVMHLFFIAILNGFSFYKKVTYISIIGNICGLFISLLLIINYNIYGALVSIAFSSLFLFVFSAYYFFKLFSLTTFFKKHSFDFLFIKEIIPVGSMTIFAAIFSPLVSIYIRNIINLESGAEAMGFYEAMQRIAGFYFLFISTLTSFYFFPELIKSQTLGQKNKMTFKFYKQVVPFFGLLLIVLYIAKDLVVQLLLAPSFYQVRTLFGWQLIGDFFRASSLILGLRFFAMKNVKGFLITESISLLISVLSATLFISYYKLEGAVMAHAFTYVFYFFMLLFYFRKELCR